MKKVDLRSDKPELDLGIVFVMDQSEANEVQEEFKRRGWELTEENLDKYFKFLDEHFKEEEE